MRRTLLACLLALLGASQALAGATVSIPGGNMGASSTGTPGATTAYGADGSLTATWFTSTSTDTTRGAEIGVLPVGTVPAAAADKIRYIGDTIGTAEVPAFVDDGGNVKALVSGTGFTEYGPVLWGTTIVGDASCAAAGTKDTSPECAREVCSNAGLSCVSAINFTVVAVPAAATCTALPGAADLIVRCE